MSVNAPSSQSSFYKCCKSKVLTHYVCINCLMVFHKCCIPKVKSQIRFVGQNKIVCCETNNPSEKEDITDALEKTICELSTDGEVKDNYIKKLKLENAAFVKEALEREDDMNVLIEKQDKIIRELKERIFELQKSNDLSINKSTKTVSIQTINNSKNVSTFTEIGTNTGVVEMHQYQSNTNTVNEVQKRNKSVIKPHIRKNSIKQKLLILSDEFGRNVNKIVMNKVNSQNFAVESIIKPGANFQQVIEDMEALTSTYLQQDHVFILAGSNNFNKQNKYPLFKTICNKFKKCASLK